MMPARLSATDFRRLELDQRFLNTIASILGNLKIVRKLVRYGQSWIVKLHHYVYLYFFTNRFFTLSITI